MATIYLTNGEAVQVSLEDLESFLYENQERIKIQRKKVRRPSNRPCIQLKSDEVIK